MFKPQIQKTRVLITLAIISLLMLYISSHSIVIELAAGYEDKIKSAEIMKKALQVLRKEVKQRGFIIYEDADPNYTGLIFNDDSPIRTGSGDLESKITTLKNNFAALIVDELMNANISKGDTVAVGMTGSMPGANIALLSACKAMEVYPVIISSLGSSTWGATNPEFNWIDMENMLFQQKIFDYKSVAYSPGGRGDCLRSKPAPDNLEDGLIKEDSKSKKAHKIFEDKIKKYNATKINYNINNLNNLYRSIDKRIKIFESNVSSIKNYSAYINIGGGAASIGVGGKDRLHTPGYLTPKKVLSQKPNESVTRYFAEQNIPLIHILHIPQLVKGTLPFGGEKKEIGEGKIYKQEKYNLIINIIALFVSLGSVVFIGFKSHNQIKKRMQSYEPESIL